MNKKQWTNSKMNSDKKYKFYKSNKSFKISKDNSVHITSVKNLNLSKLRVNRAGFIIYTLFDDIMYFMVGVDSGSHELSDFAGRIIYKIDNHAVNGAIREFQEETLEIFESVSLDDIKNCIALYDNDNLLIFLPIKVNPEIICQEFNEKYQQVVQNNQLKYKPDPDPEVCGITWLTLEELNYSIKTNGIMYSRVQDFLTRAGKFTHLL